MKYRPQESCSPSARCFTALLAPLPVDRGVDFVGQVIKPWHRYTRKRTVNEAISQLRKVPKSELFEVANSYLGLIGQASSHHHDRTGIGKVLLRRGCTIKRDLTKIYKLKEAA